MISIEDAMKILDIAGLIHNLMYYGLTFAIAAGDYYANPEPCGAVVSYRHEWSTGLISTQSALIEK